jgi:hypothetical protein
MDDTNPGLATGILLVLVGVWVVSRTLVHDAQGFNLVDRIIALAGGGTPGKPKAKNVPGLIGQTTAHGIIGPVNPLDPGALLGPLNPFGPAGQPAIPAPKGKTP